MKMRFIWCCALICMLALTPAAPASAGSQQLDFPVVQQVQSDWCWAADANAVLAYRGIASTQCGIENWVDSINYACGQHPFYWNDSANSPNYLAGTTGISGILWAFGRRDSTYYTQPLSYYGVVWAIDRANPVVLLWLWAGGGGHFVVVDGYDDNGYMLYFMNPWPGEGAALGSYQWMRYGTGDMGTHYWAESLITY
jgi:hypothetical protein